MFWDIKKAFDRIPRKVLEWAIRKKRIPEVMVKSAKILYERRKTRVKENSELSEEFEVNVGIMPSATYCGAQLES